MIRMIQRIDTEEPPWSLSESKRETLPIGYGPGARGVLEADRQPQAGAKGKAARGRGAGRSTKGRAKSARARRRPAELFMTSETPTP